MSPILESNQLRKKYQGTDIKDRSYLLPKHQKAVIGQERAVKALKFGLGNRAPGFNVYVSAPHGDEKISLIKHFLEDFVKEDPLPSDWCYVNNFKDSYCPVTLRLPQGTAVDFKSDIEKFIAEARKSLIRTLESEEYGQQQNRIKQELARKQQQIFSKIQEEAKKINFAVKSSPMEIVAVPLLKDKPMSQQQFDALSEEERKSIRARQDKFQILLESTIRKSRELEKQANQELMEMERKAALFGIQGLIDDLLQKYQGIEGVASYLEEMKQHILDHLGDFLNTAERENKSLFAGKSIEHHYQVNILVDNSPLQHAPIVVESNPTYINLYGKIERESVMGTLVTDFTLIRAGALHRANGGYLIIPIEDLLRAPFSYDHLKRSLRNRYVEIEDPTESFGFISAKSLKPEPVPLDLQVILVGRNYLMQLLYNYDDDFKELFKVKADFDSVMQATDLNVRKLCGYMTSFCQDESLLNLSTEAMVRALEYGHRLVDHQEKMTTQVEEFADLIREANYYASEDGSTDISEKHIQKTISEKIYRSNLIQEKVLELINTETILIDITGEKIGQINGLSVLDLGDLRFGRPTRITASTSVGSDGIIDIEREVKMGGSIHSKGVLILSGYLFEKFGKDKPLNLSAQIVFEQSYGEVEGDSASSAELYVILSSLANLPIKQNIAVTGSVNQRGEIQAVGAINEKIEGYYEICQLHGLDGDQGVIIPQVNVKNLMLKEEVVSAVEEGKFHIWAIENIEEGMEILMGCKAGEVSWNQDQGVLEFEEGSILALVNNRLLQMSAILKKFGKGDEE